VGDRARYAYLSLDDDVTLAGDLPRLQRRQPPELWTSSIPAGLVGETGRWRRVGNPELSEMRFGGDCPMHSCHAATAAVSTPMLAGRMSRFLNLTECSN
jgi:hypothetical protein